MPCGSESGAAELTAPAGQGGRRRIAIVHYTAPPVIGGVEQVLAEQAVQLRRAGHQVRVIAGRGDCELIPELDSRFPAVEELTRHLAAGEDPAAEFNRLHGRLRDSLLRALGDVEIVIAHNLLTMPFNLPAAAALVDCGRPILAWTHDHAWLNPRYQDFQRETEPQLLMRRMQPHTLYVAISRTRQAELANLYQTASEEIPVVPNGIDRGRFLGISTGTRGLVDAAGLGGREPLLLAPVRITRRKRLELTLEVAADLKRDHPGLGLVVSGPLGPHDSGNQAYWGELLERRSRLGLDGCVRFLHEQAGAGPHPVSERNIAELYRLADLVLLTSESEGFGLPVAEAALARVPIVCPDLPVLSEVAGGGAELYPLAAGAPTIADACRRALGSPAAALRSGVQSRYGWAGVLRSTEEVIDRVLAHG